MNNDYFPGSQRRRLQWAGRQPPICWICGYDWSKFNGDMRKCETHHIERKAHCYPGCRDVECNLFRACDYCHDVHLAAMPHAVQLAYKYEFNESDFSLPLWRQCKYGEDGGCEDRVTPLDVWQAWKELFGGETADD